MNSKKYMIDYDEYEDENFDECREVLANSILNDTELSSLEEIIIGSFGNNYEENYDVILNILVENKEKLQHVKSFFFGEMDYEDCEASWILQSDYENFLKAFPNLEKLIIKGSVNLDFGELEHKNLKYLEIITGGLPEHILDEIAKSKLPNLETLILYIGVEDYGFSGNINAIKNAIDKKVFQILKN